MTKQIIFWGNIFLIEKKVERNWYFLDFRPDSEPDPYQNETDSATLLETQREKNPKNYFQKKLLMENITHETYRDKNPAMLEDVYTHFMANDEGRKMEKKKTQKRT